MAGGHHWTEEEISNLKTYYGKLHKKDLILLFPNRTLTSLHVKAGRLGLFCDNLTLVNKKHTIDPFFFEIPNIRNSYWAGFIAADGSVGKNNTVEISIQSIDRNHLEIFSKEINYSGLIRNQDNSRGYSSKTSILSRLRICGVPTWIRDLSKNFNIIPNKTLILCPPYIDKDLFLYYIAGYLDGDGSIFTDNRKNSLIVSFAGTKELLSWIKEHIDQIVPCKTSRVSSVRLGKKGTNVWQYVIGGKRAVTLINVLKSLPIPHLERKWAQIKE